MAAKVRYTFALDAIKDADVIRWLELQGNTSAAIRGALKAFLARPNHDDLSRKLDEVLTAIRTLRFIGPPEPQEGEGRSEPERAARGLDRMVGKFSEKPV